MARRRERLHTLLHVQYGQANAEQEMIASGAWARSHSLTRELVQCPIRADELGIGIGKPGARVVPGRNLALLAVAANRAAAVGCREVWIGCNADDAADYPDCRFEFLQSAAALIMASAGVDVSAPLLGKTKAEVIDLAKHYGIDIGATWSCYEPNSGKPCGTCNACRLRAGS